MWAPLSVASMGRRKRSTGIFCSRWVVDNLSTDLTKGFVYQEWLRQTHGAQGVEERSPGAPEVVVEVGSGGVEVSQSLIVQDLLKRKRSRSSELSPDKRRIIY